MKPSPETTSTKHEDLLWYFISALILPFGNLQFGLAFVIVFYLAKFFLTKIKTADYSKKVLVIVLFAIHLFFSITNIALFVTVLSSGHGDSEGRRRSIFTIIGMSVTLIQSIILVLRTFVFKQKKTL